MFRRAAASYLIMTRASIHISIAMAAASMLIAQSSSTRPAFEVASVKLNTTNGVWDLIPRISGDRVIMHNTQVENIVNYAYGIRHLYQVAGSTDLPAGWNWYDVEAKVEGTPSDSVLRLMFQSLLEDRFKLEVHRETREMTVYDLVIAKGGPKLTAADENSKLTIDGKPLSKGVHGILLGVDGAHLMGKGGTMADIVAALCNAMRGPVEDRTGIRGSFDYDVMFARENKPQDTGPSLPAAIQATLGLKLERSKGPVEVLVIDHVEKPSEN
jgi:uncharacterized protein (TIGR03435 family)